MGAADRRFLRRRRRQLLEDLRVLADLDRERRRLLVEVTRERGPSARELRHERDWQRRLW